MVPVVRRSCDDLGVDGLATIDVAPLLADPGGAGERAVAAQLDAACRGTGFFRITGHGVTGHVELDGLARTFFAQDDAAKQRWAMARGGRAWRGWFGVGDELTSGRPDCKEGLYFGAELGPDDERVKAGLPLHGPNLFPTPAWRTAVRSWLDQMTVLSHALMGALAIGLGLERGWFRRQLGADPTVLLRVFHYPPAAPGPDWGVGEHTDYGLLTILAQDDSGGLQVHTPGGWLDVPAEPEVLVCNIGDMLDRLTSGVYRSTPHRVRNTSGRERISIPFFFDPSWDAAVPTLPLPPAPPDPRRRWDGADPMAWSGTYGEYLTAKVAKVFPDLFERL
jgi:isopenicillin N synthase-like dioxygenase